jgi:hypothetical protein
MRVIGIACALASSIVSHSVSGDGILASPPGSKIVEFALRK